MQWPTSPGLRLWRDGAVAWLELHRPEAGNALDASMFDALPAAWQALDADPEVGCVVVTGAGKAFQTGLDMRQLAKEPGALKEASRRTRDGKLGLTSWHLGLDVPVVTAVNGVCAGGGIHFVVDSDVVIASTKASFLDSHVTVGQVSAYESVGLARRGAFGEAAKLAFLGAGSRISAERARQAGWVSEVVEPEKLRERAQEIAAAIAANGREQTRAIKRALWRAQEMGRSEAMGRPVKRA